MPEFKPENSSNVEHVHYDPADGTMMVTFKGGGRYRLTNVPQAHFDGIQAADSAGSYYHRNLKGQYKTTPV